MKLQSRSIIDNGIRLVEWLFDARYAISVTETTGFMKAVAAECSVKRWNEATFAWRLSSVRERFWPGAPAFHEFTESSGNLDIGDEKLHFRDCRLKQQFRTCLDELTADLPSLPATTGFDFPATARAPRFRISLFPPKALANRHDYTMTNTVLLTISSLQTRAVDRSCAELNSGLTDTEFTVGLLLGDGLNVEQIAAFRCKSAQTIRARTKIIQGKLGVHSQAGVVGILLRFYDGHQLLFAIPKTNFSISVRVFSGSHTNDGVFHNASLPGILILTESIETTCSEPVSLNPFNRQGMRENS